MLKSLKSINLFFFILSAAILLTIALAWVLYPMAIHWLGIQSRTGFSSSVIMPNFNVLMNYLTNPFQWLLKMPQFPSSNNGLHPFEAVKYLFHLATVVLVVTLPGFLQFMRTVVKKGYLTLYRSLFFWMLVLPVVLAVMAVMIGFDQFFTPFHQVFFAGDNTWLFDPRVDSIIIALPEVYFTHVFLILFSLYEGMSASFSLFSSRRKSTNTTDY